MPDRHDDAAGYDPTSPAARAEADSWRVPGHLADDPDAGYYFDLADIAAADPRLGGSLSTEEAGYYTDLDDEEEARRRILDPNYREGEDHWDLDGGDGFIEPPTGWRTPPSYTAHLESCPRCGSPTPMLHPASEQDGQRLPCPHPWHDLSPSLKARVAVERAHRSTRLLLFPETEDPMDTARISATSRLARGISIIALQGDVGYAARWPAQPPINAVLIFDKDLPGGRQLYTYAALRAGNGKWYLTASRGTQVMEWPELVDYIGDSACRLAVDFREIPQLPRDAVDDVTDPAAWFDAAFDTDGPQTLAATNQGEETNQ